ncbi:MAG: phosphopentomutase [Anaerolineales bacterium]|jgi:phosphopentomutase
MKKVNQVILIVLDSVGIGDAPDADKYGDAGSNTLRNTALAVGGLNLPNLSKLGLGNLGEFPGIPIVSKPDGAYGRLTEISAGKDTTTGHWELSGVSLKQPFPTFPEGFPKSFIKEFEERIQVEVIGNYPASGTVIIQELGEEHLNTGKPIVYTSADSVFQIAAHEEIIPIERLYRICEIAREMLIGDLNVSRVIARPFIGKPGEFTRTENRKDFSLLPPRETILDKVKSAGYMVAGVGKIEDIFAFQGLTKSNHTGNNSDTIDGIIKFINTREPGLIFANLIDFDQLFGHRNNPDGYANALEIFDKRLPDVLNTLSDHDVIIITADHGNDPTTESTDHSRERVPLLVFGRTCKPGVNLGTRNSFCDVAESISVMLDVESTGEGKDFSHQIIAHN